MAAYKSPPRPHKNKFSLWDNTFLYNYNLIQQKKFIIYFFHAFQQKLSIEFINLFPSFFLLRFIFLYFLSSYSISLQSRLNAYSYLFICFFVYLARSFPYGRSLNYIVDRQL